jgi:hypothetical protein
VPTLLARSGDRVEPVCADHGAEVHETRSSTSASELEQMLLSTYAVDRLPAEALRHAGFSPGPAAPTELLPAARHELRQLSRSGLGLLAIAALIVAFFVVRPLGPVPAVEERDDPDVRVTDVDRFPDVPRVADLDPRPPRVEGGLEPESRRLRFGVVCGERLGSVVELKRCGAAAGTLFGFYTSPPEPMRRCRPDAYTRTPSFSVCWLDLGSEAPRVAERLRLPGVHLWDLR